MPGDEASSMDYLAVQSQSNLGVKTLQNLERVRLCVSACMARGTMQKQKVNIRERRHKGAVKRAK